MRHPRLGALLLAATLGLIGCGSDQAITINTQSPPTGAPEPDPPTAPGPNDQPLAGDQQVLDLIANQTNESSDPVDINALGLVFNENADAQVYGQLLPDS